MAAHPILENRYHVGGEIFKLSDSEPENDILMACRQAVEAHRQHPAIARWLRSPREFEETMGGLGVVSFPMVEFRDGRIGAVIWSDGSDTWGTSGWHRLERSGELPPQATQGRPVAYRLTFLAALDTLVELRKTFPPSRPWWRFWD